MMKSEYARLLGFVQLGLNRPCFLLPIFGDESNPRVQQVSAEDRIEAFAPCNLAPATELIPNRGEEHRKIGDPKVYAFQFREGSAVMGSKRDLQAALQDQIESFDEYPNLRSEVLVFLSTTHRNVAERRSEVRLFQSLLPTDHFPSPGEPLLPAAWSTSTRSTRFPLTSVDRRQLSDKRMFPRAHGRIPFCFFQSDAGRFEVMSLDASISCARFLLSDLDRIARCTSGEAIFADPIHTAFEQLAIHPELFRKDQGTFGVTYQTRQLDVGARTEGNHSSYK